MAFTPDYMEAKERASVEKGFTAFMRQPLVGALLATIPPCENLEILLRACFIAGHNSGQGLILIEMLNSMKKDQRS